MPAGLTVATFLWFDTQAEEAANLYTSLIPNSEITGISRYGKGAPMPERMARSVEFTLGGVPYVAFNGGPMFKATEAWSFSISCDTQSEIDRLWAALTTNGGQESRCGWLKDRFGFTWQIVPSAMKTWVSGDIAAWARVVAAFMPMSKLDIATLEAAYRGG